MSPVNLNAGAEDVPIDRLKPHPRNPNQGDFGAIQESIEMNGFYGRLIANRRTGHVLAGNHRLAVAKRLGMATVPVEWVDVNEEMELRILLADNRTARLGVDDESKLAELLAELANTEAGLPGTGYDGDDLDLLLAELARGGEGAPAQELLTDPDEIPEEAPNRCKSGDLWQLGNHRLLCGDSTKPEDVERLMGGEKAQAMWTDPPYGVSYGDKNRHLNKYGQESQSNSSRIETPIENDELSARDLRGFLDKAFAAALLVCTPGAAWYVAAPAGPLHCVFASALEQIGVLRHRLVWIKDGFVLGRCDYHYRHEPILYGWVPGGTHAWHGDRSQSSVFEVPRPRKNDMHPTMKPVDLIEPMLRNSSRPGEIVFEPFGGSGSTLIACEKTGRHCRLLELSPAYCDVILARWEAATGQEAARIGGEESSDA